MIPSNEPLVADFGQPKTISKSSVLSDGVTITRYVPNRELQADDEHVSAMTLPGHLYRDSAILEKEFEKFFFREWLCVGREEDIPEAGDFITRSVGSESVLVIRGQDGRARAFYNVCRHRGTRIVDEPEGKKLRSVACKYHAWTYSTEGALVGAPHTEGLADFDRSRMGLYPVRLETWNGFLWINFAEDAASLDEAFGELFSRFDRFPLDELRLAKRIVYEADANWKILIENYSECYHCAPIHPDLNRLTHYMSGENDLFMSRGSKRGRMSGGFMVFSGDYTSMVWSGYTKRPALKGMTEEDKRRVYYYVLFPNMFFSLHPDYLMIHTIYPTSPSHSRIVCDFFFDPEVMAGTDFDPSDAVELWDLINRQDWRVCELTQKGSSSRIWRGGRYSNEERGLHDFDKYVLERLDEG